MLRNRLVDYDLSFSKMLSNSIIVSSQNIFKKTIVYFLNFLLINIILVLGIYKPYDLSGENPNE